mgnify:CR=1 FL=1
MIRSLALPANLGGRDYQMRASVGVTLFPDDGVDLEDVIRHADLAMYRAKAQGRGRAIFFERDMAQRRASFTDSGLHRALRRRELSLFYQPQFIARRQPPVRRRGAAALADALRRHQAARRIHSRGRAFRAHHRHRRFRARFGLRAVRRMGARRHRAAHVLGERLGAAAQGQQFRAHGADARSISTASRPPASSSSSWNPCWPMPRSRSRCARIADLGVKLALDDFGTGYSSLNYLRRYPVHTVKLDRSFLDEVPQNDSAGALVESVITMAHTLGKRVTAEGVETGGQLEFLRSRGCEAAQGFYLARPMSAAALTEILESRRPGSEIGDARAAG